MKTKEAMKALQGKTMAELDTDLKAKKSELFNLRFQLATGQLQNTAAINECRKSIARVKTVIGDTVRVMETRPLSKDKCWRLVEIIEKAK